MGEQNNLPFQGSKALQMIQARFDLDEQLMGTKGLFG